MTNAYGVYFIGIGFAIGGSLMGVGVVIYARRITGSRLIMLIGDNPRVAQAIAKQTGINEKRANLQPRG